MGSAGPLTTRKHFSRASSPSSSATSTTSATRHRLPLLPHLGRDAAFAGIPPTKTCMNCHSQIWPTAPILEPVRESFRTESRSSGRASTTCPDFVYFNHSIHVKKGVGCATCHGRVDQMPLMCQAAIAADGVVPRVPPRAREATSGRATEVFNMAWKPPADQVRAARSSEGVPRPPADDARPFAASATA